VIQRTDRLVLAVPDAQAAARDFAALFDTEVVDVRLDSACGGMRTTLQWGQDQLELIEPTGDGPAAAFLTASRMGIFAGGFSLDDPGALASHLERKGIRVQQQDDDRYLVVPDDLDGTGLVLSPAAAHPRVGLNDKIWQITYAVPDLSAAVERYTDLLGLDNAYTNFYTSDRFGYEGAISWFDARDGGRLDSLEYLEPNDRTKAVARFVERNGPGIYMASIETDDITAIKARVTESGNGWQGTDFGGFIHPRRTHGLLLGLVTYENWNANRPLPDA
jgi:catechol 2,3-dioxygenase-like lactoylglutathione lyase family enzyme